MEIHKYYILLFFYDNDLCFNSKTNLEKNINLPQKKWLI